MKNATIKITKSENCGYCIEVNGEAVFECLAKDEVETLSIREILSYADYMTNNKAL